MEQAECEASAAPGGGRPSPVGALPSEELTAFLFGNALDDFGANPKAPHHIVIYDDHPATSDRTHRQLFMAGNTELADQKDVKWLTQRGRDFVGHRNAPSRQPQDDNISTVSVTVQRSGEGVSRISPVTEETAVARSRLHQRLNLAHGRARRIR